MEAPLSFLGTWKTNIPNSTLIRQNPVISYGQWNMNSKDLCQDGMKQFLTSLFCHGSHRKPSYWEGKGSDLRTGKIGKLQVKEPKMEDFLILHTKIYPGGSEVKSVFLQCGRPGFDPWVGKIPWRRKWQPIPVFLPGEPMDGGAWWATIHGVAKSQTQLSNQNIHTPRDQQFYFQISTQKTWNQRLRHLCTKVHSIIFHH